MFHKDCKNLEKERLEEIVFFNCFTFYFLFSYKVLQCKESIVLLRGILKDIVK